MNEEMYTDAKWVWDGIIRARDNAIARAEAAEAALPRWIPVEERLPENGKRVLVSTDAGYVVGAFHMWFKQWTTDEGVYFHTGMYDSVTHWMPLPEPLAHDAGKERK